MSQRDEAHEPAAEDRRLVDVLESVLVDPNLHTDLRMRLHREIAALLRTAHEDLYGPAGREVHERTLAAHGEHLPSVLKSVLVDPNLHTDLRMRLHREIAALLRTAREPAGQSALRPAPSGTSSSSPTSST